MYMIFRISFWWNIVVAFFILLWAQAFQTKLHPPTPAPHTRFLRTTGCWPNDTLHGRRRLPLTSARVLADDTALRDEKEVGLVYKGEVHAIKRMPRYILPRSTKMTYIKLSTFFSSVLKHDPACKLMYKHDDRDNCLICNVRFQYVI